MPKLGSMSCMRTCEQLTQPRLGLFLCEQFYAMLDDPCNERDIQMPYRFIGTKIARTMLVADDDLKICAYFQIVDGNYVYETQHGFVSSDLDIVPSLKAFIDSLEITSQEVKIDLLDAWEEVQTISDHDKMRILS